MLPYALMITFVLVVTEILLLNSVNPFDLFDEIWDELS